MIPLVRDGAAAASILVASDPSPAARLAAREVQHCVLQMTGAELPIRVSDAPLAGIRLVVDGTSLDDESLSLTPDALGLERYEHLTRFVTNGLVLLGRDAAGGTGKIIDYTAATGEGGAPEEMELPGMFDDQGTLRAAYDFLERFCGVRFYGPSPISVVIPTRKTLEAVGTELRREPAIKHASGSLTWRWPLMNGQYGNPTDDALALFARRIRLGGIPWYTNHTLHHYPTRFPQSENPEFYAADGGGGKLCYSSSDLAKQVAEDARSYFGGNDVPGLSLPKGSDYYPVVPEDAARFCRCAKCRQALDPHANDVPRTPGGREIFNDGRGSHLWFGFVNQVARELAKTHPDKYVSTLAYESYYWYPTEFRLEPNVAIAPCMQTRNYWHMTAYANELGHYSRWVTDGRPVFLWNYYCFPEEPAVIRKWHCFPGFAAHELAKLAVRFARDHVLGTFFCGIGEQVDFYLTMKLYDDPTQDIDELLNEFFRLYFGGAAAPMQAFYTLIESTYSNPANWDQNGGHHQTEAVAWEVLGTAERMAALEAMVMQAVALAQTPLEKQRVGLWKTGVWDYMATGRKNYLAKVGLARAPAPHSTVAPDYIKNVVLTASAEPDRPMYTLTTGYQMVESTPGVLGTRDAKLDIRNDADRHWAAYGPDGVWVEFDLGQLYQLDEIRIWNYQQNRGFGLNHRGMRNVIVTVSESLDRSNWREVMRGELPRGDDSHAFGPSKIIDVDGRPCRFVRITARGGFGVGNWDVDGDDIHTGLGQVRFYGKPPDAGK